MFGFSSGDLMTLVMMSDTCLCPLFRAGSGVPGGMLSHDAGCIPADFV
jgi:hypothetical protein